MTGETDRLADVFVLGLMQDADAERAEARLATDHEWARAVGRARDRFLPLDLAVAPQPLPAGLWDRLVLGRAVAANLPFAPRLRRFLPAAAAVVALACGIGIGSMITTAEPLVVAVLVDDTGAPRAIVEDYGSSSARVRFVSDVPVPEGRQMQVWTLPSQEMGPVSLGLLAADRASRLDAPDLPVPADGQLYEITLEPEGGSPTGRPTGPILAKGLASFQGDV